MRILYAGELVSWGTCAMRLRALQALGHEAVAVDFTPPAVQARQRHLWPRLRYRLRRPLDLAGANAQLLQCCRSESFDLIWLDKANTIWPETLKDIRRLRPDILIVGYSPDDMASGIFSSSYFFRSLPLYDLFFTTKTYNVEELTALGARRVLFVGNGYDPDTHRPVSLSPEEQRRYGADVGFVGYCEQERAEAMLYLAEHGIHVRIIGEGWQRWKGRHERLLIQGTSVHGQDYAKAICAAKINLGFLRKMSRDRQTTRSVEIPACGSFMLAERTEEHRQLFEEGKEAVFFESNAELLDKARYYLAHPEQRVRIAEAGRQRCLDSGYSNHGRMRWMLERVAEVRSAASAAVAAGTGTPEKVK